MELVGRLVLIAQPACWSNSLSFASEYKQLLWPSLLAFLCWTPLRSSSPSLIPLSGFPFSVYIYIYFFFDIPRWAFSFFGKGHALNEKNRHSGFVVVVAVQSYSSKCRSLRMLLTLHLFLKAHLPWRSNHNDEYANCPVHGCFPFLFCLFSNCSITELFKVYPPSQEMTWKQMHSGTDDQPFSQNLMKKRERIIVSVRDSNLKNQIIFFWAYSSDWYHHHCTCTLTVDSCWALLTWML